MRKRFVVTKVEHLVYEEEFEIEFPDDLEFRALESAVHNMADVIIGNSLVPTLVNTEPWEIEEL